MNFIKRSLLLLSVFLIYSHAGFSNAENIFIPEKIDAGIAIKLNTPTGKAMTAIWSTVFKRVGVKNFNVDAYPGKRLSKMLADNDIDFDMWRVRIYDFILLKQGVIKKIEQIIKVPEWNGMNGFELFAKDPEKKIKIDSGKDLINTEYKVDYLDGHVWAWYWLPRWVKPQNLHSVREARQSLNRILLDRLDLYCASENTVLHLLKEKKYKDAGIRKVGSAGVTYLTGWFSGKFRNSKYLPFLIKVTDEVSKMRHSGEAVDIASKNGFKMN
ncbi:conserved hypothetical protein, secreted [Candidatus Magnetomorum sp. HK-1]|nr:conserved hypothetical protein, secreted [Candidatus Magnetomorum sp. HK-1]